MTSPGTEAATEAPPAVWLRVEKPGILLTVQDLGRAGRGLARFGVSPSGALDPLAARLANLLCGNAPGVALLEITGAGAALVLEGARPAVLALAGADLDAAVDGAALAPGSAREVAPGSRIRFAARRRGARAYLAAAGGGLAVAPTLGSAASDLASGLGGPPLGAGARVALAGGATNRPPGERTAPTGLTAASAEIEALAARWYQPAGQLRFVPSDDPRAARLDGARYQVTARSDRSGYRLSGPPLPPAPGDGDRLSEGLPAGALQLPPDGQPILLLADRQTVGGYPLIGAVIRADLPRAAQLWPGDGITFAAVTRAQAQALARAQEDDLAALSP